MLQDIMGKHKTRWHAFYTWCLGGFNIGWDLGQGLLNFLPQGFLGLLLPIEKDSKLFELPLLLNKLVGPIVGSVFAVIALIPAIIEGLLFKRPYKKFNDQWSTALVDKYGVRMFWGAMAVSVAALIGLFAGYLPIAVNTALILPITLSYIAIALAGVSSALFNLYGSMTKLYVYRTKSIDWQYTLKGLVNIQLDKADEVKDPLNKEFIYETEKMSALYDEAYAQIVQQTNQAPTLSSINRLGVLSYYELQKDQSDFLTRITHDKKYASNGSKLIAIEERHRTFETKYKALT